MLGGGPTPSRNPFVTTPTDTPLATLTAAPIQTPAPIFVPTFVPGQPTPSPEELPSPTLEPTAAPTQEPTAEPTLTETPTIEPTAEPTQEPTAEPTLTETPTLEATTTTLPTSPPPGVPTPTGGGGNLAYFSDATLTVRDVATGAIPSSIRLDLQPQGPPAISPDGQTTLIDAIDSKTGARQIYAFDGKGRSSVLTQGPGNSFQPMWQPDGNAIVFASDRGGTTHLYIMDRDGTNQRQLTTGPGNDAYPSFSSVKGDERILFESTRDDPQGQLWAIFTLQPDTGVVTRVSAPNLPYSERSPRWSPDGQQIAFIANPDRSDVFNVYTQRTDQVGSQQLTMFATGTAQGPTWSPDGKLIALFGDESGSNDLYIVAADGSALGVFLPSPANDPAIEETWPSWNK